MTVLCGVVWVLCATCFVGLQTNEQTDKQRSNTRGRIHAVGTCCSGTVSFLFVRCRYLFMLRFSLINWGKWWCGWGRACWSHAPSWPIWRPTTVWSRVRARQKALEGTTDRHRDRQTHTRSVHYMMMIIVIIIIVTIVYFAGSSREPLIKVCTIL